MLNHQLRASRLFHLLARCKASTIRAKSYQVKPDDIGKMPSSSLQSYWCTAGTMLVGLSKFWPEINFLHPQSRLSPCWQCLDEHRITVTSFLKETPLWCWSTIGLSKEDSTENAKLDKESLHTDIDPSLLCIVLCNGVLLHVMTISTAVTEVTFQNGKKSCLSQFTQPSHLHYRMASLFANIYQKLVMTQDSIKHSLLSSRCPFPRVLNIEVPFYFNVCR